MLSVSRSGYYDWLDRCQQPNPGTVALDIAARAAHARGREGYGALRLRTELAEMGFTRSLSAVKRLRKRLGLYCRHKRRFVRTTDGNHSLPIAPNLLEQRFDQSSAPNQVWVTDITYVPTDAGWLYVAAIKDLFSKKIVGWAMADHMRVSLVSQALLTAVDGGEAGTTAQRSHSPQRPGQPVCEPRVSTASHTVWHEGIDESSRQLLRQRADGELLGEHEERASASSPRPDACRGQGG